MELELWKLSRVKFLSSVPDILIDEGKEICEGYSRINELFPVSLIEEIGSSDKFHNLILDFLQLETPVKLWVENETINVEPICKNAIRYEMFAYDIEGENAIDVIYMIFNSLENLHKMFLTRETNSE